MSSEQDSGGTPPLLLAVATKRTILAEKKGSRKVEKEKEKEKEKETVEGRRRKHSKGLQHILP